MTSRRKRQAPLILLAVAAALLAATPAFADPRIADKRAEAEAILRQIHSLDADLELAVERYNYATYRLRQIQDRQRVNAFELRIARRNLKRGQKLLAQRIRAIYLASDQPAADSTLEIILGAKSLDDVLNRIDTVNRVSAEDAKVIKEVKRFKRVVHREHVALKKANAQQSTVVAQRRAAQREIESTLAERERMLAGVRTEIEQLVEAERRRQELLRQQAAARLAAQRAAQERELQDTVVGPTAVAAPAAAEEEQEQQQDQDQSQEAQQVPEAVAESEPTVVAPPSQYGGVVGIAMQYLGVPYVWGGASPSGFDCSGLVQYVYAQVGVSLPHSTYALWEMGTPVSRDQLQPGDLVFFNGLGHMGIYIGGGQMIHAPRTGDVVKISDISSGWYLDRWVGARRVTG